MAGKVDEEVREAGEKAVALDTLERGPLPPVGSMFEDAYREMPCNPARRRREPEPGPWPR